SLPLDAKGNAIASVRVCRQQIGELDLAIERVHVVAILIDLIVRDRSHDVPDLESRFHCWRTRLHVRYINSTGILAFFSGELAQRGVACRKKREAGGRKPAIILAFSIL